MNRSLRDELDSICEDDHVQATGPENVRIGSVTVGDLEGFLPLIEEYQRFYEVEVIERGRNRGFFGRLIDPSPIGSLIGAWLEDVPVGYSCLHWTLDSVSAFETVTLNDLFVIESARGQGIGRALIRSAQEIAGRRGARQLVWNTAPTNLTAQRLYDTFPATRSEWIQYELEI